jgi:phosphomannomutase
MLAALHAIAALQESSEPLSKLLKPYQRYESSGEINSVVKDQSAAVVFIQSHYRDLSEAKSLNLEFDHLDGLTVTSDKWWFNVRASNTEPLLRLNAEGNTERDMVQIRDEVLKLIKSR